MTLTHVKEFLENVLQVFDEWHKHTMTVDKTIPEEVFANGIDGLHRFDDTTLDFLFWPAEKRLVRNSMVEMTLDGFGKCRWYASNHIFIFIGSVIRYGRVFLP